MAISASRHNTAVIIAAMGGIEVGLDHWFHGVAGAAKFRPGGDLDPGFDHDPGYDNQNE